MARRYRPRKEFKFWLYQDIEAEVKLTEYIDYLRKTRQFARTIRNGLRLIWTLGEGDLSVLFELFPTLRTRFDTPPATPTPGDDFNKLLIEAAKEGAKQAMLESPPTLPPPAANDQGQRFGAATVGSGGMGNLKTNFVVQAPTFDDDEDDENTVIIKRDENAGNDITANLVRSFMGLADAKPSADAKPINAPRETTKRAPRDDSNLIVKVQVRQ